jgi:hypothetical protein
MPSSLSATSCLTPAGSEAGAGEGAMSTAPVKEVVS